MAADPVFESLTMWDRYPLSHAVKIAERMVAAELAAAGGDRDVLTLRFRSRDDLDHGDLPDFLAEHLAHHKRPKIIEVCEGDLPRNFLGKVLRRKVREAATP